MAERIIKRVDKVAMTVPSLTQTIRRYKRVAAYARVSTASDEQMNSVEAQKDYFEKNDTSPRKLGAGRNLCG